jgi:hypothetical protein
MSVSHAELKFSAQILGEQKAKCQALFFAATTLKIIRRPSLGHKAISPNGR